MTIENKELWIGTMEVRSLNEGSDILGESKGAFVNVVTWASDSEEYRLNIEKVVGKLGGIFVADIVDSEPVEARRVRTGGTFAEEIEDMILRARDNPKAIIYGTFHMFDNDNA